MIKMTYEEFLNKKAMAMELEKKEEMTENSCVNCDGNCLLCSLYRD